MPPVRAKTACEIARIEPSRFNEAVHAEAYPCAPATTPGRARLFRRDDIVALQIFGALISLNVSERRAGKIACDARELINDDDRIEAIDYFRIFNGAWHIVARYPDDKPLNKPTVVTFNIPALRRYVEESIELERDNTPVGED